MKITRSQKSLIRKSTCHKFNVKRFGLTEMSVSKDFRFFQSTRWLLRSPSLQIVSLKRFFIPSFNLIVFILLLFQLIWIFQQFKSFLTYLKKFNEKNAFLNIQVVFCGEVNWNRMVIKTPSIFLPFSGALEKFQWHLVFLIHIKIINGHSFREISTLVEEEGKIVCW